MTPEEVADRFDNRVGHSLVAYGRVGLPIYRLTAVALCLAKKTVSPIEEFVLRVVAAGVDSIEQIGGLLGLDPSVIDGSIAELLRMECVRMPPLPPGGLRRLQLTPKGESVARDQEVVVPLEQTLVFCVDGLTRKPKFYPQESLYRARELKDEGVPEIRASPSRAPELSEIDIKDVIGVVNLDVGKAESPRQLLRINAIERRDRIFHDAVALLYRSETGGELKAAFAVDGRLSVEHEQAFARARGLERNKIFSGMRPAASVSLRDVLGVELSQRVSELDAKQGDSAGLRHAVRSARSRAGNGGSDTKQPISGKPAKLEKDEQQRVPAVEQQLVELRVRPLAVYEHAPLLKRALDSARDRVVLVSPWIRKAVVDHSFMRALRQAISRGVAVYMGYGLGEADKGEKAPDKEVRQELEKLAIESKLFVFKRLGDTHAKILIKDSEFFVITSFNWLSFKGDPQRTFREEWGTLVTVPSAVDEFFERIRSRFD